MRRYRRSGGDVNIAFYVERDGEEIELEISGYISPYEPGRVSGPIEDCHPPEGGECEILEIMCDGKKWDGALTDNEIERVERNMEENLRNAQYFAEEDAQEREAEAKWKRYRLSGAFLRNYRPYRPF